MKGIVHSSEVSDLIPISFASLYDTSETEHTYGFISKNSLWMCLVHDTSINIFSTETGSFCGNYNFGDTLKNPSARITNVCELSSSHIPFQCLLVSVKQDHESLLCMYNVDANEIAQAVLIPDRISALDVVSGDGGVCMETHYLNRRLRYMFGIAAIGTVNGHVYFLDLCLDESFSCDETEPNITIVLKQHEYSAQRREIAISKKQHIFLRLNDESDRTGKFELHSRSSILGRFPNSEIYVSAVKYFRTLASLAVGFSFGGIQLWELHDLTLQFTISTEPHTQPIVNFAFQEPENDPRNFCYLWVFRGHSATERNPPTTVSCASMYSMTFYKREQVKGFGTLYVELNTCTKRFEFLFTNDIYHSSLINPSMFSRLLSCQVISQKDLTHSMEAVSGNESCEVSEEMSLCFITWEVWSGNVPSSYHFAAFDLNQWYQAQMPSSFRCDPSALSPYFGIFSVNEARQVLGRKQMLGLHVNPQSIRKFKSLAVSEEFFYPSSLGFQIISFSQYGLCKATYFGFQKHLLFEMAELGPKVLINPREVYSSLIKCGLVADSHNSGERTPLIQQKEAILQLALEYHLPFFFTKCMKEWRYSDSVHEYCTSRALLNWAWKKVMSIKSTIDRLSVTLFNCSGVDVDKTALKSLYAFRRQLNLIDNIMAAYQKYVTPRTEQGIQDLQCRREAVSAINLYLQVLLWFRSAHVLPEVSEDQKRSPETIVYYVDEATKFYLKRRVDLQTLNSSIGINDVLLIDGIVQETNVISSWQEKGGEGMYPPPSIYAALSVYLLYGVSTVWKHALTYYFLLDLKEFTKNTAFHSEVKKFPTIFGMTKSIVKLVKAFWYLDRREYDLAIKKLLDPSVKFADILPWQHHRIIKSFLYYRAPQRALKYVNHMLPPQNTMEDMRLYLSVLLACGAITQAFEYQRKKQMQGYGNDLLKHLFLGCQQTGKMRELMYLPLNSVESAALIEFLSESEDPRAQEALVIYHLLHCKFFEAEKVNDKLTSVLMKQFSDKNVDLIDESDALIKERTVDRNVLIESLMSGISKTEKNLVAEMNRLPPDVVSRKEISEALKPLSISVKSSTVKKQTYSDFLTSLMHKAQLSIPSHQTPLKSRSFIGELPFLRPVCTPETVKQPSALKSNNHSVNKRSLSSTSPSEFSSPAKRSRLLDNATFKETPMSRRKTPKHLAGDIASLLQTPPIPRRFSSKFSSLNTSLASKPSSILKKSQSILTPTQPDFALAETPPLLSEELSSEDEDMQVDDKNLRFTESENQSKQIRFAVDESVREMNTSVSESNATAKALDTTSNSIIVEEDHNVKKSTVILTREPLEGFLKQAYHSKVNTTLSDSVKSTRHESKVQTITFESSPMKVDTPKKSPISDKSKSPAKSLEDYRLCKPAGIPSVEFSSRTIGDQKLSDSPRLPLRKDDLPVSPCKKPSGRYDENDVKKNLLFEKLTVAHMAEKDSEKFSQQSSAAVLPDSGKNVSIEKDSDDEMFYSPSTDSPVYGNNFSRLGAPIPFLDDSCSSNQTKLESEASEPNKESGSSSPSRKAIVFSRQPLGSTESQLFLSEKTQSFSLKKAIQVDSMCTTPVEKSIAVSAATESSSKEAAIESGNQSLYPAVSKTFNKDDINSQGKSEQSEKSYQPKKESAPRRKTYIFTRGSTATTKTVPVSSASNDVVTAESDPQSKVENIKASDVLKEKISVSQEPEILPDESTKPPRKTFFVTQSETVATDTQKKTTIANINTDVNVTNSSLQNKQSKESQSSETSSVKNTDYIEATNSSANIQSLQDAVSTSCASGYSVLQSSSLFSSVATTKPSRKKYVFTRKTSSTTASQHDTAVSFQKENESTVISEGNLKSDTFKPAEKTFVITKPDTCNKTEIKSNVEDCDNNPNSSNQRSTDDFTFSKPFQLCENVVVSDDISQKNKPNETFVFAKPTIKGIRESGASLLQAGLGSSEKLTKKKTSRKTYVFSRSSTTSSSLNTSAKLGKTSKKSEMKSPLSLSSKKKLLSSNRKSTKPSRKTYVFTRNSAQESLSADSQSEIKKSSNEDVSNDSVFDSKSKKDVEDMEVISPKSGLNENIDFLQDTEAETYEQFSSTLTKSTPFEKSNGKEQLKPFLSSPCASPVDESNLPENKAPGESNAHGKTDLEKKETESKLSGSVLKSKKKKSKAKVAKKLEFSFAEPHSPPADILEALSQTPEKPLPTFLFSPPLTRGRLRQKKINETLGSSISSEISEVSFSTSMRPPMDTILEGIIQEKSLQTSKIAKSSASKSTAKKKVTRKPKLPDSSMNVTDQSLLSLNESSFLNSSKQAPSSPRHSMVLRQSRSKRDTSLL